MKNSILNLVGGVLVLSFTACQMDQTEEIEGPTLVEKTTNMGPSNLMARINNVGKDGKEIFDVVEDQPNPPGGLQGWNAFLKNNLSYPQEAKTNGVEGTVIVVFTVNSDGSISNPEILRGIGGGADEEAIRLVSQSPNWKPGYQDGIAVNTRMRLPIRFKLSESNLEMANNKL
ncbi:energy transducer TonB [Algoriphagus mannitolivorans]|uniref:energy transducer TonB n=1 Tax=Algoriphagus mannitolivorans TaxID=226504 RepID=UPI000429F480|nr:energy transducer TonB [Algoriphagus mannitolivorans]